MKIILMKFKLVAILMVIYVVVTSASTKRIVALVVDAQTYNYCNTALNSYSQSINDDNLTTVIIIDKWSHPDSIKIELRKLYSKGNLEGIVLIGDIPIPMIRNAQHLTTAFKMDQSMDWSLSSVPSDRFYDDFDLKFDYIKRDSIHTFYHYYNLCYDSPQIINCDIYSARIKPPLVENKSKYQLIDEYLNKIAREKKSKRKINSLTYFAGYGYNSNCIVARNDEKVSYTEQFNVFRNGSSNLNFIDYSNDNFVKARLMEELSRTDLDLAILHHHGGHDSQLLSGTPPSKNANDWIRLTKKFFRGFIRDANDTSKAKSYCLSNYDIPFHWVENAFDPIHTKNDSIEDASRDITIQDLNGYVSNVGLIILDACSNGSFHLDNYIAGHYIFNPGRTIVVKANTVNSLQDIWTNELIGLLDLGVSVGNWAKGQMTLESHLLGDPTYKYISSRKDLQGLNGAIVTKKRNSKYWKKAMNDSNPEVKSLAMVMLYNLEGISTDKLLQIQKEEERATVRLQAFNLITKKYSHNLISSIQFGLQDNYELLRRLSAIKAGKNQSPEILDIIMQIYLSPGVSSRVSFQLNRALINYSKEEINSAYNKVTAGKHGEWFKNKKTEIEATEYIKADFEKRIKDLPNPDVSFRNKRFTIMLLRNSNNTDHLDILFKFLRESSDSELKTILAEAFGWYSNSWKRDEILKVCFEQLLKEEDETVKKELHKTVNRLEGYL